MDIKVITQEDITQAQNEVFKQLERYQTIQTPTKQDTQYLVKAFASLVDLQNDFINQLITEGQVLADAIKGIPQNGQKC